MSCSRYEQRCPKSHDDSGFLIVPECCSNLLLELFHDFMDEVNRLNVPIWADYGTLLGCVRDGKRIKHDDDMDWSILAEHKSSLDELLHSMSEKGYDVTGAWSGTGNQIFISKTNRLHLDIFIWFKEDDMLYRKKYVDGTDDNKGKDFPVEWLGELTKARMNGRMINIPKESEKLLSYRYGDSWVTPQRVYGFNNNPNNNKDMFSKG